MRAVGVVVGAIVAAIVIFLMTWVAHLFYADSFAAAALAGPGNAADPMLVVPNAAKLTLAVGWFLGALAGATVANLITRQGFIGWIVAGLVVLYVLLLSVLYPHPTWLALIGVVLPLLGGHLARRGVHIGLR